MTAYLVGMIDVRVGLLIGADYFSEPNPTSYGHMVPVVLADLTSSDPDASYGEELAELKALIKDSHTAWYRPFIRRRGEETDEPQGVAKIMLHRLCELKGGHEVAVDLDEMLEAGEVKL